MNVLNNSPLPSARRAPFKTIAFGLSLVTLACSSVPRTATRAGSSESERPDRASEALSPAVRAMVPGGMSGGLIDARARSRRKSAPTPPTFEVRHSLRNVTSRPLREIARPPQKGAALREIPMEPGPGADLPRLPLKADPVLQTRAQPNMPSPIQNFEGTGNENSVQPADTTMAIGPNHVFQWVNLSFQVFDKSGVSLAGPFDGNTLFTDLGGDCAAINGGDIIVLYDQLADRWVLTQLAPAIFGAHGNHQCIAVSAGGDPLGSYYLYDYLYSESALNDYPKFGVWPDAYQMTVREFGDGFTMTVTAFDRQAMLAGQPLTAIFVSLHNPTFDGLLPAYLDGPIPPPGTVFDQNGMVTSAPPELLMGVGSPGTDGSPATVIHVYQFHPDFAAPAKSTFTGPSDLPIADFNAVPFFSGVPQPPPGQAIEALGWVLYRLPYRNYGTHESVVMYHDVMDAAGRVLPRWYEIRDPYGVATVHQQATFGPDDGVYRWMGSIAMDALNDIAVGFSVSDATSTFPGIRYAGRLASDPPGELTQGEAELIPGVGSFEGHRWGDYSTMDIDPSDDCTFWYTQMYVAEAGLSNWFTRVGSFKFPGCVAPQLGTIEGTVTDGTSPIAGAHIVVTGGGGGGGGHTDAAGHYSFQLPAGSHGLTATKYGYVPGAATVSITAGGDTVQDFVLSPAPTVSVGGTVTDASGAEWPLYARIVITTPEGPTSTVFADPVTGQYATTLFASANYNFTVTAVSPGYLPGGGPVPLVARPSDATADWTLAIDPIACNAPGYSGSPCTAGPGGLLVGNVLDANTGNGVNGSTVANLQAGSPSTTTFPTPDDPGQPDGFYILYADAGSVSLQASHERYTSQTRSTTVVSHDAVRLDFTLPAGLLDASPRPLSTRLDPGGAVDLTLQIANSGGVDASFQLRELTVPGQTSSSLPGDRLFADPARASAAVARVPRGRLDLPNAKGLSVMPGAPPRVPPLLAGNVLNSYPTQIAGGWGIAFNTDATDFWVSNRSVAGGDDREYRYLTDGTLTGDSIDDSVWMTAIGEFAGDGAFNARTGMLWRLDVGGDNCIHELDPIARVATGNTICGSPWTAVSQRGLAYDVTTDTYYVGGWNEGVIYHVDSTGAVLESTFVGIPISGLAYDPTRRHLFALTNHGAPPLSVFDVFVFDARHQMNLIGGFNITQNGQPVSDFLSNGGAGLEIDCDGHLWAIDQVGQLIWEVQSGESNICAFNDIPWLSEDVVGGTVSAGSSFPVVCTFDSSGLSAGLRLGQLKVSTDTPYAVAAVPVDLTVRFSDVSDTNPFEAFIYAAAGAGVMPGCDAASFRFCPAALVTRADMAGFILRGVHGADFVPEAYAGAFLDVHAGDFNADYIQSFFDEGYTVGCGGGNFCPSSVHTRGQTAVFILRGEHGPSYVPPPCASTHVFDDVPCPPTPEAPFGDWIGQLYVEGITAGCGGNNFCPDAGIPNQQMAVFLVKAFGLPHL